MDQGICEASGSRRPMHQLRLNYALLSRYGDNDDDDDHDGDGDDDDGYTTRPRVVVRLDNANESSPSAVIERSFMKSQ